MRIKATSIAVVATLVPVIVVGVLKIPLAAAQVDASSSITTENSSTSTEPTSTDIDATGTTPSDTTKYFIEFDTCCRICAAGPEPGPYHRHEIHRLLHRCAWISGSPGNVYVFVPSWLVRFGDFMDQRGQVGHFGPDRDVECVGYRLSVPVRWRPDAQAIDNLLNNAIKYSRIGGCIEVALERQHQNAVVRVKDQGPSLSPEDLSRVFGRFQRLSAKPTGNEISTGLGLS